MFRARIAMRGARGARASLGSSLVALAFLAASLAVLGQSTGAAPAAKASPGSGATKQRLLTGYGQLPLSFVPNAGQLDSPARYYTAGRGYRFSFEDRKATIDLVKASGRGVSLDLRFVGASPGARLQATTRAQGTMSFLKGDDPARWQRGLPTYHGVSYRGLWPGIDMRFRGAKGQLKYDFVVRPGASVGNIKLAYRGAQGLSVGPKGSLLVGTPLGGIEDSRPVSYQRVGGRRVPVESRYSLAGATGYGFSVGGYDPRYPLVIDPGLAYSTFLGDNLNQESFGIDVDQNGNAYVTGSTGLSPNDEVFVTKLNPTGTAIVYTTLLGGTLSDIGEDVVVDGTGQTYVTGETNSPTFPTTSTAYDTSHNGIDDAFVGKLNATGTALVYSTFLGGALNDQGRGIQIDESGNAYVAGVTSSGGLPAVAFPTTTGAFDTTHNGADDAFVTKLNRFGSALVYSTFLGGTLSDVGRGIDVDGSGNAYATGFTTSGNFPTTLGAHDTVLGGTEDAFVTKLNGAGSAQVYSTFLGGTTSEEGSGIALDAQRNVYVTGVTTSMDFPTTTGAFDMFYNLLDDVFVTKLNASGQALVYSTYVGGDLNENGQDIAVNRFGEAYVTGPTNSLGNPPIGFPTTPLTAYDVTYNGGTNDAYMTKLNAAGTALVNSTFLGASSRDQGRAIAVDWRGDPYVTGFTQSSEFPTTPGAHDRFFNGLRDVFVTKFDVGGPPPPPPPPPGDDD